MLVVVEVSFGKWEKLLFASILSFLFCQRAVDEGDLEKYILVVLLVTEFCCKGLYDSFWEEKQMNEEFFQFPFPLLAFVLVHSFL